MSPLALSKILVFDWHMTEYDQNPRYKKMEDNVYFDSLTEETVFVLTPDERAIARSFAEKKIAAEKEARDAEEDVRLALGRNPNTPSTLLTTLARADDKDIRAAAATNPNTPQSSLAALANDSDGIVRKGVAGNPRTSEKSFRVLARDHDSDVRRAVAQNPATPAAVLKAMSNDESSGVQLDLIRNPETPLSEFASLLASRP